MQAQRASQVRFKAGEIMRAIYAALLAVWVAVSASDLNASPTAFDNAGDSAYNNFNPNSTTYPNGGFGWGGPWQSNGALFVNQPGLTGPGHPADTTPINSPTTSDGRAWGISYFLNENLASASRPLAGALLPGQSFSMDLNMRTAFIQQYGEFDGQSVTLGPAPLGYGLTLERLYAGGYRIDVSGPGTPYATYDTGLPFSDQFVHLDVTVIDDSSVRATLTSLGSDGATASLVVPDNISITYLSLTNQGFGYLPDAEMYFNNIQITPEPAGLVFCAVALAATLFRRRRPAQI